MVKIVGPGRRVKPVLKTPVALFGECSSDQPEVPSAADDGEETLESSPAAQKRTGHARNSFRHPLDFPIAATILQSL